MGEDDRWYGGVACTVIFSDRRQTLSVDVRVYVNHESVGSNSALFNKKRLDRYSVGNVNTDFKRTYISDYIAASPLYSAHNKQIQTKYPFRVSVVSIASSTSK